MTEPSEATHVVASIRRDWPDGPIVWNDASGRDAIVGPIMRAAGGPATADVWFGEPPASWTYVHDGPLDLSSGWLAVTDAAGVRVVLKSLPAGTYRARLCVDRTDDPEHASLHLVPIRLRKSLYQRSLLLQTAGDVAQSAIERGRRRNGYRYGQPPSPWWHLLRLVPVVIGALVIILTAR